MATANQQQAVTNAVTAVLSKYLVSKLMNEEKVAEEITAAVIQAYELNAPETATKST
jgi:hypothetical protein